MTTQYTTILKLALPVQGELSGTWGDVVNNNITQMVEQAVAGKAVINTWTGNSHTLTTADGTTSESRCAILELTDSGTALTGAGTVVCPTNTKLYIVDNNTAEIITVQTAAGTGVAVPVGKTMLVYCDGTNVVEGVTHANSLSLGTSTVTADKILDEDNMASDSATAIATQQSIKAYVDSQVGTVDTLSEILANGNTTGANDIDVDSAQKVQFRDADIYLNSSVDGQLDIVADTEIQIAATTVDLNGNLDVSGTALVAGVLTTTAATVFNGGFASNADSTLGTDKKVQFRDAAIYLNSSVDGQLDIVADGEVQIDTALVDINGNLDVSGTTNISGSVSFTKNAIAGVAISTTSRASNTVTVTTSAVHGLTSGDLVNVNGVADTSFNGYFTVSVSSTTVFTYSQTGADGSSTGGTSTEVVYNLNASGTALNWMNGPLNIAANSGIDGLEITQSGAGNGLHVTGTTGLVGNTTLTGNLDVSGTTLVTGVLTTTAATVFNGGFASNADSTLGTDKKVQFRDSAIYINSSVDGQLDIVADTEIQIAATTVDLNGNLDVSGTALVTGVLTTTAATVFNGGFASNADSTLGTDKKVQFRDSAIYINSSADGQLDLVADTEIQIAATTIDVNGTLAFDSLKGTGATTVTNILDEDDMASDSATAIATQQSIKAYVDSQVGSFDTLAEVLAQGNTTGGTDLAVSTGDDITFADSSKAIFGAGSDLQIYSDGTTGQVTGNVNVTGSVTADGLTVDASSAVIQSATGTSSPTPTTFNISTTSNGSDWTTTSPWGRLAFYSGDGSGGGGKPHVVLDATASNAIGASSSFSVSTTSESANTLTQRLNLAHNGDISFYSSDGLSKALFWDASAESLGIGTTSPDGGLDIEKTVNTAWSSALRANDFLQISNVSTTGGSYSGIELIATGVGAAGAAEIVCIDSGSGSGDLAFSTRNSSTWSEKVRILAGGNVGIGNTSPDSVLEVNLTTSGSGANNNTAGSSIGVGSSATAQPILGMRWTGASHVGISGNAFSTQIVNDTANSNAFEMYTTGASPLVFGTAATERMRINASGNVGIGTSSPAQKLSLSGASGSARFSLERNNTNTTGGVGSIQWNALDGHAVAGIVAYGDGNDEGAHIAFNTTSAASSSDVYVSTTEAMRLDSSGNALFGRSTSTNPATDTAGNGGAMAWWENSNDGFLAVSRNNGASAAVVAVFNRTNGDGGILGFHKDGTTVGSIGTNTGGLYIADAGVGVRFDSDGTDDIIPCNATGAAANGTINLGSSGAKFNDLYLSGGALTSTVKFLANTTVSGSDATIFRPADNTMAFSTGGAERLRIDASGGIYGSSATGMTKFANNVANYVSVADDGTITLTGATAGAMFIHVYDQGLGDGAVFFATYRGIAVLVTESASNTHPFEPSDTDGAYCVIKTSNSHTVTFKNRTGATRQMGFLLSGANVS
jgi:hypothetical protein